jgi:hypothetical protein
MLICQIVSLHKASEMEFIMSVTPSLNIEQNESIIKLDSQIAPNINQMTLLEALAQVEGGNFEFEPPRMGSLHKEIDLFKLMPEQDTLFSKMFVIKGIS